MIAIKELVLNVCGVVLSSVLLTPIVLAQTAKVPPSSMARVELGAAATSAAPNRSPGRYYIDFRVAQVGTYGHSYVAYGRLNERGKPADAHYADLHPVGNYLTMAFGHVLPVPANTEWDPDVLKLPVASSYFRTLTAAEYAKLQAAVRKARADRQPYWNAFTNNCNHFVAELARAIGLQAPTDLQISYMFVPALREMNGGSSQASGQAGSAPKRTAPDRTSAPLAQPPGT
jgi:hypothetical protein